jgi:hypothetical protein
MNPFKSTCFTWWQLGLLKWATLFFGLGIGALWPEVFAPYATILIAIGIIVGIYLGVVWMRNK